VRGRLAMRAARWRKRAREHVRGSTNINAPLETGHACSTTSAETKAIIAAVGETVPVSSSKSYFSGPHGWEASGRCSKRSSAFWRCKNQLRALDAAARRSAAAELHAGLHPRTHGRGRWQ